ncbi:hypothetical protein COCVIDRAFT_14932 [Bipolaris victoriae FI3]|uniref:Uncharacterized protein n=1 Tax=Bipolaris victoriae (strain FI3) TaxID=930091 RepID=W7ECP2_BIPV3|nr:hypothetical protein COCVIDRAFT_14932 [Bipolaris victoriae FI3]
MHMPVHTNNSRVGLEEIHRLLLDIMAAHPPLDLLTSLHTPNKDLNLSAQLYPSAIRLSYQEMMHMAHILLRTRNTPDYTRAAAKVIYNPQNQPKPSFYWMHPRSRLICSYG